MKPMKTAIDELREARSLINDLRHELHEIDQILSINSGYALVDTGVKASSLAKEFKAITKAIFETHEATGCVKVHNVYAHAPDYEELVMCLRSRLTAIGAMAEAVKEG